MSGKKSRNKGLKGEREARKLLQGLGCEIIWNAEDPDACDVTIKKGKGMFKSGDKVEIKYRQSVPKAVYNYFEEKGADVVLMRRVGTKDRSMGWLVVRQLQA